MACLLSILMILFVSCSLCVGIPIKPISPEEGATDECYGTQCYYDDTDYTDTNVKVIFPENFTNAILHVLPTIQGFQNEMITFMNKTLISQDKVVDLLERRLENNQGSQNEIEHRLERMESLMESGLQSINEQIKNMTATITDLMSKTVNILQKQLDLLTKENHSKLEQESTEKPSELPTTDATPHKPLTTDATPHKPSTEIQCNQVTTQATQTTELPPVTDCQDITARRIGRSGPYAITPPDGLGSFEVYCDFTDNEGWTVFQKRFNGSVNFYRNWTQYEQGFGDKSGEYWLGLKNIHRIISDGTWALQIDLESFDGETAYAVYDSFGISDAASNYILSVGEYSGNAGDSLKMTTLSGTRMHNGMAFTTYDRDNDAHSVNCAKFWKGAWWYNRCHTSHLNGQYLGPDRNDYSGMMWYTWKERRSLKSSQMKIRRVQ